VTVLKLVILNASQRHAVKKHDIRTEFKHISHQPCVSNGLMVQITFQGVLMNLTSYKQ